MRRAPLLLPAALALAAASLSGCLWWWDGPMHGTDRGDPDFPIALLGILLVVGGVLLAVNLSSKPPQPPSPPPPPTPPAPPEEPPQRSAKARRRQP